MNLVFITDFEYIFQVGERKFLGLEYFSLLFPQLLRFSLMRKTEAKMTRVLDFAKSLAICKNTIHE